MTKPKKTTRGRPSTSGNVRIVAVPHDQPDARKLSRAFLALALHQAAAEAEAQKQVESTERADER